MKNYLDNYVSILQAIKQNKVILFLNKYPNKQEAQDGYFNRVLFIDQQLTHCLRIYINEAELSSFNTEVISSEIIQLNIPIGFVNYNEITAILLGAVDIVYAHSIYQLMTEFKRTLFTQINYSIWDVHGAVPEEMILMDINASVINQIQNYEFFAVRYAKLIICVTEAMVQHIKNKYLSVKIEGDFITLPIVSVSINNQNIQSKKLPLKPIVLYSGGVQVWQQVDKMLQFVNENQSYFKFIFLVSDPIFVANRYEKKFFEKFPGVLTNVTHEELNLYYEKANYGLLFRENNTINNVACPTKLIDYLSFGIVPVVESENIGDFIAFGVRAIRNSAVISEFCDNGQYVKFINENYKVLSRLIQLSEAGLNKFKSILINKDLALLNPITIKLFHQLLCIYEYYNNSRNNVNQELSNVNQELSNVNQELSNVNQELSNVYNSHSWKITKPFRIIMKLTKKIF